MDDSNSFIEKLINDIQNNRITLPSLPEVAVKVRKFVDDPRMGVPQLAKVISTDPALSARLLQVANSPFFRCLTPSSNLNIAIGRLGGVCVRNVVTSLVMAQLYKTNVSGKTKVILKENWEHSTNVAAYCGVIAKKFTRVNSEQAMLAGLVHNIGALPILNNISTQPEIADDETSIKNIIFENHTRVGEIILKSWEFPEEMIEAVINHENLQREHQGEADIIDVVMVGNLHALLGSKHPLTQTKWTDIPAFEMLGLTPEESIEAMKEAKAEIQMIQRILKV
ncbi:MAG: HDOD domain-containing protein [Gammaproteobacteria bacterium]|nr:MAG: HDOD domain-containing protein [Gammaproteobacteria bacterium]